MTTEEARALRALLGTALETLYAARLGSLPAWTAVLDAIAALHKLDKALLDAGRRDDPPAKRDAA